jgi:conjugal transfer pilus assembly protein TraL
MSEADYAIPRRLNDPMKFLWWDADVFVIAFAPVALGILAGSFLAGLLFGLLMGWAFGRVKAGKHKAYALHALYWHGGEAIVKLKRTPPSHFRELIG